MGVNRLAAALYSIGLAAVFVPAAVLAPCVGDWLERQMTWHEERAD